MSCSSNDRIESTLRREFDVLGSRVSGAGPRESLRSGHENGAPALPVETSCLFHSGGAVAKFVDGADCLSKSRESGWPKEKAQVVGSKPTLSKKVNHATAG